MLLTLTSPTAAQATEAQTMLVRAPGITIGSDPHNDWTPDRDAQNLCPVHAAIRVEDGGYTLVNLASRLPVLVNGVALACQASARLHAGDHITLGACRVTASATSAPAPAPAHEFRAAPATAPLHGVITAPAPVAAPEVMVAPAPVAAHAHAPVPAVARETTPEPVPAPKEEIDPFADLLGPGTLPLGAAPAPDTTHPFDMASAAPRNAADPLAGWAQRPATGPNAREQDPLALFDAAQAHEVPDVFTDHTPSVLDRDTRKRS